MELSTASKIEKWNVSYELGDQFVTKSIDTKPNQTNLDHTKSNQTKPNKSYDHTNKIEFNKPSSESKHTCFAVSWMEEDKSKIV